MDDAQQPSVVGQLPPTQQQVAHDDTTPVVDENVAPVVDQPQQPEPPVSSQPVGGFHKEQAPISSVVEAPVAEILTPTEQAPELHPEVQEAGVEVSPNHEVPDLTLHDKNAGLSHAPVIAPVPSAPSDAIHLPMPEEKAAEIAKKDKNASDSILWLALSVLRQFKILQREKKIEKHG